MLLNLYQETIILLNPASFTYTVQKRICALWGTALKEIALERWFFQQYITGAKGAGCECMCACLFRNEKETKVKKINASELLRNEKSPPTMRRKLKIIKLLIIRAQIPLQFPFLAFPFRYRLHEHWTQSPSGERLLFPGEDQVGALATVCPTLSATPTPAPVLLSVGLLVRSSQSQV